MSDMDKYCKPAETIVSQVAELELLSSRIQDQRRALIALDERRQKLREAEGMLRKSKKQEPHTWICLGSTTFLQFSTETAADFMAEDRQIVENTITETEKLLRKDTDELLKKEGKKDLVDRGFNLKPVA